MTWAKASSKFPTDVKIEVAQRKGAVALRKKDNLGPAADPPPGSDAAQRQAMQQGWDLYFTAGAYKWSSGNTDETKLPFFRVGAWDGGKIIIENGIPKAYHRPVCILRPCASCSVC